MSRKAFDIVGYTFKADLYCPACIVGALPTGDGDPYDGWALGEGLGLHISAEDNLSEVAIAFQIDRGDESTFDSDDFPKVVFDDMVAWRDRCCVCGIYLDDVESL